MNKFFSQLRKDAQELRLSKPEKEAVLLALEAAMRANPLTKSPLALTPSPYFFFVAPRQYVAVFVLILFVLGSGSSYAAEGAVPGDFLYAVKLGINEPLRATLASSVEAKASWHAEAAERRMKEAEVLSAAGTLTSEIKMELESNLEQHAEKVAESMVRVREEDPVLAADIEARFESSLAAHSAVIARLSLEGDKEENRREAGSFARSLKERERKLAYATGGVSVQAERDASGAIAVRTFAKQDATTLSASIEIHDADDAVIFRLGKNASTTLEEAEVLFEALKDRLSASTTARVKAQIKGVRKQIEKSQGEGVEGGKRIVENALKDATTINAFLEAESQFEGRALLPSIDVEVSSNGDEHEENNNAAAPLVKPLSL